MACWGKSRLVLQECNPTQSSTRKSVLRVIEGPSLTNLRALYHLCILVAAVFITHLDRSAMARSTRATFVGCKWDSIK